MAKRVAFAVYGDPDVLRYVEFTPRDPGDDEVQIENKAIGVNFIDTYVRSGLYPVAALPSGLGSEGAGIVRQVGRNVRDLKPGDRVVYAQSAPGAYSEIHNVAADKVVPLPEAITFEQAAAIFLKGLTVWYLFNLTHDLQPDECFLFHAAAGGVGHIACQWAKAKGARMIGTASSAQKIEQALEDGAWRMLNSRQDDIVARVLALTDQQKVGVVYDSVGKATWEVSLDCLRRRGLMVSFGNASGPVTNVNLAILNQKGSLFVTRPSLNGYLTSRADLLQASRHLFDLMQSGALKARVTEQQRFALADAAAAHRYLLNRQTHGACLLIP